MLQGEELFPGKPKPGPRQREGGRVCLGGRNHALHSRWLPALEAGSPWSGGEGWVLERAVGRICSMPVLWLPVAPWHSVALLGLWKRHLSLCLHRHRTFALCVPGLICKTPDILSLLIVT